jgi:hypothetical protein
MRKVRVAGDIKNMWLIGYSHLKKSQLESWKFVRG